MRTLKDREKVLYAPFSNVGALKFEKTTGYITIPDSQVIYTRLTNEEEEGEGDTGLGKAKVQGIDSDLRRQNLAAPEGNEGQKMVWHL